MRRSLPTLATSLFVATPTETVSPVADTTSALMRRAISGAGPKSASEPATSRKASSIETCSTAGVKRRSTAITSRLTRWYLAPSTGRKMPFGHSCSAVRSGMAECTPNLRAS